MGKVDVREAGAGMVQAVKRIIATKIKAFLGFI
jgi:hypothetical protein